MKRNKLTSIEAAQILFGDQIESDDFDPHEAQFSSGADVCAALASWFGFTDAELRAINATLVQQREWHERVKKQWPNDSSAPRPGEASRS